MEEVRLTVSLYMFITNAVGSWNDETYPVHQTCNWIRIDHFFPGGRVAAGSFSDIEERVADTQFCPILRSKRHENLINKSYLSLSCADCNAKFEVKSPAEVFRKMIFFSIFTNDNFFRKE